MNYETWQSGKGNDAKLSIAMSDTQSPGEFGSASTAGTLQGPGYALSESSRGLCIFKGSIELAIAARNVRGSSRELLAPRKEVDQVLFQGCRSLLVPMYGSPPVDSRTSRREIVECQLNPLISRESFHLFHFLLPLVLHSVRAILSPSGET